jgi:hypothetical protein
MLASPDQPGDGFGTPERGYQEEVSARRKRRRWKYNTWGVVQHFTHCKISPQPLQVKVSGYM